MYSFVCLRAKKKLLSDHLVQVDFSAGQVIFYFNFPHGQWGEANLLLTK